MANRKLPVELQGALLSLYGNYEKYYRLWEQNTDARPRGITPPVFIVVCNNTNVSKLVFDFIAGWEKQIGEQTIAQTGQLPIFRNDDGNGAWLHRPNTILVDSRQLESGESMSDDFKKIAAREIEEFKAEYRARFPGRDTESLTDEDLLREVMNTVGKARQARRTRQVRGQRLHAHGGLGRQHRHSCSRRARLRHATSLRTGSRPRPASHELCP